MAAAEGGTQIWVAQGTYRPDENSSHPNGTSLRTATFKFPQGVAVYGGFPPGGLWEHREPNLYQTILTGDIGYEGIIGDNCYNVITGANDVILDGFTIADSYANTSGNYARGGAIHNDDVNNMTVANCKFQNHYALYDGGAIYNYKSSMSIINCVFSDNRCGDDGAGVYNSNSSTTLINCAFFNNNATNRGGGIYNYQTPAELINCLFKGNHAHTNGGAAYNSYKSVKMTNCTIVGNSAGGNTGGIYNAYSTSNIANCIVWDSGIAVYNHNSNPQYFIQRYRGLRRQRNRLGPKFRQR